MPAGRFDMILRALMICAAILLLAPRAAEAQVTRCQNASGEVTYTQGACPQGTRSVDAAAPGSANGARNAASATPPPDPATCREGGGDLAINASDEDIRACSTELSLPSTSSWAQMRQHIKVLATQNNARQWTGDYICLKAMETPATSGERPRRRTITVSQAMRDGQIVPGFQVGKSPQIHPTKVAAVEAGCAVATAAK
jgi:hypothetical protein